MHCALAAAGVQHVKPLLPEHDRDASAVSRAQGVLDTMHPLETIKAGVILVSENEDPTQFASQEAFLLSHRVASSPRYMRFLTGLGMFCELHASHGSYTGGLSTSKAAEDGEHMLVYTDSFTRLVYHVTSLMPNHASDPQRLMKKRHIGNDFVNVVYTERAEYVDFQPKWLSGEFHFVYIVVQPLPHDVHLVHMVLNRQTKGFPQDATFDTAPSHPWLVPDGRVAEVVRFLIIIASTSIMQVRKLRGYAVSNWEARSQQLQLMEDRFFVKDWSAVRNDSREEQYCVLSQTVL
jgi:hypothetical protein